MIGIEEYIAVCKCKECEKPVLIDGKPYSVAMLTFHHNNNWLWLQSKRFNYACACGNGSTPEFFFMNGKGEKIDAKELFKMADQYVMENLKVNNLRGAIKHAKHNKGRLCYSAKKGFVCWVSRFTNPTTDLELIHDFKNYSSNNLKSTL